jgi:hypothetical protein
MDKRKAADGGHPGVAEMETPEIRGEPNVDRQRGHATDDLPDAPRRGTGQGDYDEVDIARADGVTHGEQITQQ